MSDPVMADRPGGLQSRMAANVRSTIRPAADEGIDPIDIPRAQPEPRREPTPAAEPERPSEPAAVTGLEPRSGVGSVTRPESSDRVVPRRTKRHEALVQINVKLTPAIRDTLDLVAESENLSIRDTLQMLISEFAREHNIESTPE